MTQYLLPGNVELLLHGGGSRDVVESSGRSNREKKLYSSEREYLIAWKMVGEMTLFAWPYLFRSVGKKTSRAFLCASS